MRKINRKLAALLLVLAAFLGLGVGPAAAHAEAANFECSTAQGYAGGTANIGSLHYLTDVGVIKSSISSTAYFNIYVYRNNGVLVWSDSSHGYPYIRSWPNPSIFVGSGGYVDFSYRDGYGGVCYDRGNAFL